MVGLTEQEAHERLRKYGLNTVVEKDRFHLLKQFLSSLFSPLVIVLLAASFISALLGDVKDFLIIFSMVMLSGIVSFYQHFKAEKAADQLKQKVHLTATVMRNGKKEEVPFSHITVGDLVLLSVGDIIPADGTLLDSKELSVDESILTGEAFPIEKEKSHAPLFMGTHVVSGEGSFEVTQIGKTTRLGQLSKEIVTAKPPTSFDTGLKSFSYLIIRLILLLAMFVFIINAFFRHDILNSFLFALALAVGLTPELLPIIITITLSRGAVDMEKKEVIVKFLPSIQNLGSMNILCTDKTGTLTESSITLQGYENGKEKKEEEVLLLGVLTSFFQAGFKNPLDLALLATKKDSREKEFKKIDEIPFDFTRKCLSVIVKEKNRKENLMITKGEPHHVSELLKATEKEKHTLMERYKKLSSQGLRVIAVAKKPIEHKSSYSPKDEKDLTFVGFLTFVDPVKESVAATVTDLEDLGVKLKILTGDNEFVTKHVCSQVGIPTDEIVLGQELDTLGAQELYTKVQQASIFARLTPEQKAKVITILKKQGNVVGFLGDGINDAPPLKVSDVGISVNNGSDIAREVADIVLMKKSLVVLQKGVLEGRRVHGNILKFIQMQISSNFGNMLTVAAASLFLPFLPILPAQLLLLDFLYDLSQITIPSDTVDKEFIQKPRSWDISNITKFMVVFGPISSLFDFITFFLLLGVMHASASFFRTGWFVESLITQTLIIFAIRTRHVPFFRSRPSWLLSITSLLVLGVGTFLTQTVFRVTFNFIPLPTVFYLYLIAIVAAYFIFVELGKMLFYKKLA